MRLKSSLLILILMFSLTACSLQPKTSGITKTADDLEEVENIETNKIELTDEIVKCDVYKHYGSILNSYMPEGYEKTLDYGMYFSGSSIIGNNGDLDEDYLCYTIDFKQNNKDNSFIIPCNKISTLWLNRILLSLIEDATQNMIEDGVESRYVAIRGLKFKTVNSRTNLLSNQYGINLNNPNWNSINNMKSDIVIYASLVNTDDKKMLLNYVDDLSRYIEKQGYNIKLIIKEY